MRDHQKGFTLLELLIVIAILAILSAVTIIVLNPAELLKKARDSQRISDLSTIKTSIGYYVVSTSSPVLGGSSSTGCSGTGQTNPATYSHVSGVVAAATYTNSSTTAVRAVDGTGWIPVNLSSLSGGSPLGAWPIDPNASASAGNPSQYYAYVCKSDFTFELFANLESIAFSQGGGSDAESTDGGSIAKIREDGTVFNAITATSTNFYPNP